MINQTIRLVPQRPLFLFRSAGQQQLRSRTPAQVLQAAVGGVSSASSLSVKASPAAMEAGGGWKHSQVQLQASGEEECERLDYLCGPRLRVHTAQECRRRNEASSGVNCPPQQHPDNLSKATCILYHEGFRGSVFCFEEETERVRKTERVSTLRSF